VELFNTQQRQLGHDVHVSRALEEAEKRLLPADKAFLRKLHLVDGKCWGRDRGFLRLEQEACLALRRHFLSVLADVVHVALVEKPSPPLPHARAHPVRLRGPICTSDVALAAVCHFSRIPHTPTPPHPHTPTYSCVVRWDRSLLVTLGQLPFTPLVPPLSLAGTHWWLGMARTLPCPSLRRPARAPHVLQRFSWAAATPSLLSWTCHVATSCALWMTLWAPCARGAQLLCFSLGTAPLGMASRTWPQRTALLEACRVRT
jgi:hypothetical protein